MTLTEEMAQAFDLIEDSDENLYITGKAGTGKTTFLKYILQNTKQNYVVAAPTGVAAINAGGMTLHSLFNIPMDIQSPTAELKGHLNPARIELFAKLDLLIIDEISMVRVDVIDYIDRKLRLYRLNGTPFGGVRLVMFGDLYQLPPVVKAGERAVLMQYYRGAYFFYAQVFRRKGFRIIELSHVFRQSDENFIRILNNIRKYKMTNLDVSELEKTRDRRASADYNNMHIHVCAYRRDVQKINMERLGEATHHYQAVIEKDFKPTSAPCEQDLALRVGARVMTLVNDPHHLYYNGSLGEVLALSDDKVTVKFDNGAVATIEKYKWVELEYQLKDGKIEAVEKGTCSQIPLALAWAITIHKSQGLTFNNVTLHIKNVFCPGQLYVALSRCRTLEGIICESYIGKKYVIPDNELIAFDRACQKCGNVFDVNTYRSMCLR